MRRLALQIATLVEVVVASFLFFMFMLVAGKHAWRFLLPEEEEEAALAGLA
jgi:hypothetical protein